MTTATMKITRKGQVTLPKEIRERLNADFVYFEMKDDIVLVKPVRDAAGALREYAENVKPGVPIREKRNKAWVQAIREKTGKKDKVR
jgi:AbrB family looped-hinge helix DNA binding protein